MKKLGGNEMFNFGQDVGIDLGTATVIVYVKGKGIVLRHSSNKTIKRWSNIRLYCYGKNVKTFYK